MSNFWGPLQMQLSRVNDIGGCRAVLASVDHVYDLQRALLEQTRASWELTHLPSKYDYVARPKDSGYRSVHLVYAYQSDSEEHADFDGQRIEIQLRSKLQHSWATANEIAETFTGLPLKSEVDPKGWTNFGRRLDGAAG